MEVPTILELRELVAAVAARGGRVRVSLSPLPDGAAASLTVVVVAAAADATALARTVVGLAKPVSGRVMVGPRDVTDLPPGSRQLGYLPAGGALLPHLTVRQNIEYLLWRRESVHEIIRGWEAALIHQLELGPVLDQRPHEITAQQRMRAALARAVVSLPEVLIMERPDPTATGPLRPLLARVGSAATAGPATVVFTETTAAVDDTAPDRLIHAVV
ncbi:MAG: hypothetical protein QOE03_705 [Micromonosporaceae bacterium]|jgi:ABC-type sulfate/molybdate transport systems ATPase subunit|nr:hypothetical protein [Micromonosporaceae bacterium]